MVRGVRRAPGAKAVPRALGARAGLVATSLEATMRVTVCELPHEPEALAAAWAALCEHTVRHSSELVLLPEFAMVDPVWQDEVFDAARWAAAEALSEVWRHRLPELRVAHVVGTRPVTIAGR